MNPILHELQTKRWVWSAKSAKQQEQQQSPASTGFSTLDSALNAGFPQAGMIHISSVLGCGELRLLLSIIQHQQPNNQRYWVMITPPGVLNAEFLLGQHIDLKQLLIIRDISAEEALWSAEQCARSSACAGVFVWQSGLTHLQIRKLELAAQHGQSHCVWFVHSMQVPANMPLSLSMSVSRVRDHIQLTIHKQKHGWAKAPVSVPLPLACGRRFRARRSGVQQPANVVNLPLQ